MWIVYAMLASMFWGLNYVIVGKILDKGVSPSTMIGIKMMFIAPLLLLISPIQKDIQIIKNDSSIIWWIIFGMATFAIADLLIVTSIKEKNAALAGLIEISYPIFTLFFAWLIFGTNHLSLPVAIGGAMIFGGVFVIYYYSA